MANRMRYEKTDFALLPTRLHEKDAMTYSCPNGHFTEFKDKCDACIMMSNKTVQKRIQPKFTTAYQLGLDEGLDRVLLIKSRANHELRNSTSDPDEIRVQMLKGFWNFMDSVSITNHTHTDTASTIQTSPFLRSHSKSNLSNHASHHYFTSMSMNNKLAKAPLRGLLDDGGNDKLPIRNFQACLISAHMSERISTMEKEKTKILQHRHKKLNFRSNSNMNVYPITKLGISNSSMSISNQDLRTKSSFA